MSAAWPRVTGRLVELLPTLPGWSGVPVYDGPPVTGDVPFTYCTVGYVVGEDVGGIYEQVRGLGNLLEETGSVRCEVVAATGEVDLPAVRARAFALVDEWEAALSADRTLAVLSPDATSSLSVDVQPAQTTAGAVQRLTVIVNYFSRGLAWT